MFCHSIDGEGLTQKSAIPRLWGSRLLEKERKILLSISNRPLNNSSQCYVRCIHHHPFRGIAEGMHEKHRSGKCVHDSSKILLGTGCPENVAEFDLTLSEGLSKDQRVWEQRGILLQ